MRNEDIKLKLDISGEQPPIAYPYSNTFETENEERFNGDFVSYKLNGKDYKNIYGTTFITKKENGTKTEIWLKRALEQKNEIPELIDEMSITAQLFREKYEERHFGLFRITAKRLVLVSDETQINTADAVIGPLRYYVAGTVSTEVFSTGEML
jgi:hypothetical protein